MIFSFERSSHVNKDYSLSTDFNHLNDLLKYLVRYPGLQSEKYLEYILHILLSEIKLCD